MVKLVKTYRFVCGIVKKTEASDTGDICFSPCNPVIDVPQICFEANVISFENAAGSGVSNVLGSTRISNIDPGAYGFQSGWMYIDFYEPTAPGTVIHETNLVDNPNVEGHIYYGLPVTGFWAQAGKNDFVVDGTKVNFGALYRHRATRDICAVGCS